MCARESILDIDSRDQSKEKKTGARWAPVLLYLAGKLLLVQIEVGAFLR